MLKLLAHRGMWQSREEQNTLPALNRALQHGYGVETDIRDRNGELVICHDPADHNAPLLSEFLATYQSQGCDQVLALNIKADGLQQMLATELDRFGIRNYFVFDMSIPDTLHYLSNGFEVFMRKSELEFHPVLTKKCQGLWMDEPSSAWFSKDELLEYTQYTGSLALVSAELHGRDQHQQWQLISDAVGQLSERQQWYLCTDFPELAERTFG